jgi:hypothetical protein
MSIVKKKANQNLGWVCGLTWQYELLEWTQTLAQAIYHYTTYSSFLYFRIFSVLFDLNLSIDLIVKVWKLKFITYLSKSTHQSSFGILQLSSIPIPHLQPRQSYYVVIVLNSFIILGQCVYPHFCKRLNFTKQKNIHSQHRLYLLLLIMFVPLIICFNKNKY